MFWYACVCVHLCLCKCVCVCRLLYTHHTEHFDRVLRFVLIFIRFHMFMRLFSAQSHIFHSNLFVYILNLFIVISRLLLVCIVDEMLHAGACLYNGRFFYFYSIYGGKFRRIQKQNQTIYAQCIRYTYLHASI